MEPHVWRHGVNMKRTKLALSAEERQKQKDYDGCLSTMGKCV